MALEFEGKKYVKVKKGGVTYNVINVRAVKNGVTYNVWGSGSSVTYVVDNGEAYAEDVLNGDSVLSPKTFTPSKSGYTFVGWREDKTASATVLTSKTMGTEPITLYAVFKRTLTLTYYDGFTTKNTTTGTQYYNNGNTLNPSFAMPQKAVTNWTTRGWATSTDAEASITYKDGATISIGSDTTIYGCYSQTIKVWYNGNGSTGGSTSEQSDTRYWNSAGNYSNPSFTLASNGFSKTERAFSKWAMGSADGTQYSAGDSVTLSASTTFYAIWIGIPFYWFQRLAGSDGEYYEHKSGYPREWTKMDVCCEDNAQWDLRIEQPGVSCDNWDAHLICKAEASAKGNKYATIYVVSHAWGNSKLTLNGTVFTAAGTHTVDVSATDKLSMELLTHDGMVINYIYFHN